MRVSGSNLDKSLELNGLLRSGKDVFVLYGPSANNAYQTLRDSQGNFYQVPASFKLKIIGCMVYGQASTPAVGPYYFGTGTASTTSAAPAGSAALQVRHTPLGSGGGTKNFINLGDLEVEAALYPWHRSDSASNVFYSEFYCYLEAA